MAISRAASFGRPAGGPPPPPLGVLQKCVHDERYPAASFVGPILAPPLPNRFGAADHEGSRDAGRCR